jgi:hypothetical protein
MLDDDGLPLDEVGAWAKEKHERLRKYVDISRAARRKFVEGPGGASYIDLYCGSGRAVIRDRGRRSMEAHSSLSNVRATEAFHFRRFTLQMTQKKFVGQRNRG